MAKAKKKKTTKKKAKAAKPRKAAKKSVTVKDLAAKGAKSMKTGLAALRRRLD